MTQEDSSIRRGLTIYRINPFMTDTQVVPRTKRITNNRGDMMITSREGEVVAPIAGFWQAQEVDSAKFVKVYVNGVRAFRELTNPGARVFEALFMEVQNTISKDRVYLSFRRVDQLNNPMGMSTFRRGVRELIEKKFIAPTEEQNWYWLNPDYMWNGDRLAFVREYRKVGAPTSMPEIEREIGL